MAGDMRLTGSFAVAVICAAAAAACANCSACENMTLNCTEANSTNLSCDGRQDAGVRYAISLSRSHYKPGEYINVKVHMTECPTLDSASPTAFTLRASTVEGTEVGRFSRGANAMFDTHLCNDGKMAMFKPCHPFPLDLPQTYYWTATAEDELANSTVYFKLTVHTAPEEQCDEAVACLSPSNDTNEGPHSSDHYDVSGMSPSDYEDYYDDSSSHPRPPEEVPPTADHQPDYRHTIRNKCKNDYDMYIAYQRFYRLIWLPTCDCQGMYKRLQCYSHGGSTDCWCSTNTGAEVIGSRKELSCNNSTSFEFKCTQ